MGLGRYPKIHRRPMHQILCQGCGVTPLNLPPVVDRQQDIAPGNDAVDQESSIRIRLVALDRSEAGQLAQRGRDQQDHRALRRFTACDFEPRPPPPHESLQHVASASPRRRWLRRAPAPSLLWRSYRSGIRPNLPLT